MILAAILWSAFSGLLLALGFEPTDNWRKITNNRAIDSLGKISLGLGCISSFGIIYVAFFNFVLSNSIVVLASWVLSFVITRVVFEVVANDAYQSGVRTRVGKTAPLAPGEPSKTAESAAGSTYEDIFNRVNADVSASAAAPARKKRQK